jgi:hypothetical protein
MAPCRADFVADRRSCAQLVETAREFSSRSRLPDAARFEQRLLALRALVGHGRRAIRYGDHRRFRSLGRIRDPARNAFSLSQRERRLDGAHPLALHGLIEHYAAGVMGKNVVLHCNPMWMREPKTDLQDEAAEVNHPRLVPQFAPNIRAYKEEVSPRLGILVEQRLPFTKWTSHLQQAYFRTDVPNDIPTWTLAHPYADPLQPLRKDLPPSDNRLRHLPQPWFKSGITKQDFPWVDLETSLQWQAFQRTVKLLQERGNRVYVLVGPFNEHLLKPESLQRYEEIKGGIVAWLEAQQIPHLAPSPLPSEDYGDASHPLASGYARLASLLLNEPFFK